jgi:hypothetical protein
VTLPAADGVRIIGGQPPGCDVHAAVTALLEADVERGKK